MRRYIPLLVLLVSAMSVGLAQAPPPSVPAPAFHVASIKRNQSGSQSSSLLRYPGGRLGARNVGLRSVIRDAYDLRPFQLIGGPDWVDAERFDIDARGPENAQPSDTKAMLRTLLIERFKLVTHTETRELPIYALMLARRDGQLGPEIKASGCTQSSSPQVGETPCAQSTGMTSARGRMDGNRKTMAELAFALAMVTEQMVLDRTGLTGIFDYKLQWTPDSASPSTPAAGSDPPLLFTAIQEQLGLRLESQTGPVEILVIDSVERPTPD